MVGGVLGARGGSEGDTISLSESILVDRAGKRTYLSKPLLAVEDEIATSFALALERAGVGYSIVAGYIAILLGDLGGVMA